MYTQHNLLCISIWKVLASVRQSVSQTTQKSRKLIQEEDVNFLKENEAINVIV